MKSETSKEWDNVENETFITFLFHRHFLVNNNSFNL